MIRIILYRFKFYKSKSDLFLSLTSSRSYSLTDN